MDLGTALIALIIIGICVLPFVLSSRSKKKNEKKLLLSLHSLAEKQQCIISQYEVGGNYAIGIDETKNFVFFQSKINKEIKPKFIDISTIRKCNLVNISRSSDTGNTLIDQLYLEFIPTDKNKKDVVFEFYNSDVNVQVIDELQSIKKWSTLINSKLGNK